MNWDDALKRLDEYREMYSEIPTGGFGLILISNLKRRYDNGERTQELFDEIMSIE